MVMEARTAYVFAGSMRAGSMSMANEIGTCPGPSMRTEPITMARASARDTSSTLASNTASGGSAMRSRFVAVPVTRSAAAGIGIKTARHTHTSVVLIRIGSPSSDPTTSSSATGERGLGPCGAHLG